MELKDLGLTKEEIFAAVVTKITSELLRLPVTRTDEDGTEYEDYENTPFQKELQKHIKNKIDITIAAVVDKYVLPNAEQHIANIALQKTNSWGEPKSEKQTFVEYLTAKAERFMIEDVDYQGKPKGRDSYSWSKNGTRIEYMIDKYLQYHIETWAKTALGEANKSIVNGLQKAVESQLQHILKKLKFGVSVK